MRVKKQTPTRWCRWGPEKKRLIPEATLIPQPISAKQEPGEIPHQGACCSGSSTTGLMS